MPAATQQQVKSAIISTSIVGTPAQILSTITANSIERVRDTRLTWQDLEDELSTAKVTQLDTIFSQDAAFSWVRNSLAGSGVNFSTTNFQNRIDAIRQAGKLTQQEANAIKRVGRWNESPLEVANNQRNLTTDEATVIAALAEIAADNAAHVYDQKQAVLSLVMQPNGKAILGCRVVQATTEGRTGSVLLSVSVADVDARPDKVPVELLPLITAIRAFVAGV